MTPEEKQFMPFQQKKHLQTFLGVQVLFDNNY